MSNSDHSNETKSSIGKNAIVGGVDLCAEISNVLKSMMPSIEKKTLKKVQAILETKERWKEEDYKSCKTVKYDHKVLYSSFMLRGKALYWWNMIKESRGKETLMSLSRDQFKKLVFRNYILESQKHRLEEFNHVDQEYENVHDYTVKFYKYVRFGTINEATEKKKIEEVVRQA
ncbi:zinc finger, CCHC-type, retrotransposon gag domain protein [Tanacetum coccineum]